MSNRKKDGRGKHCGALGAHGVSCGGILQQYYSNNHVYPSTGKNRKNGQLRNCSGRGTQLAIILEKCHGVTISKTIPTSQAKSRGANDG